MKLGNIIVGAMFVAVLGACLFGAPAGALQNLSLHDPLSPPSWAYPFGTDDLGRDVLAAVAQGGRTSMIVAIGATLITLTIAVTAGLASGFAEGALDQLIMRIADIVASLPVMLIAVLVAALYGGSMNALIIVIGFTRWPVIARLIRLETMALRRREFVMASVALGASPLHILRRHILPHVSTSILAASGIIFGGAILAETSLAFVGLGDPRHTSWGQLIAIGGGFMERAWWIWAFPAAAVVLCSAMIGYLSQRSRLT
ncbi:MAG: ABC transporter permease [Sphingopyxis sp.]|nr:ABC transporter permease [Sphingopyxis sp.]